MEIKNKLYLVKKVIIKQFNDMNAFVILSREICIYLINLNAVILSFLKSYHYYIGLIL